MLRVLIFIYICSFSLIASDYKLLVPGAYLAEDIKEKSNQAWHELTPRGVFTCKVKMQQKDELTQIESCQKDTILFIQGKIARFETVHSSAFTFKKDNYLVVDLGQNQYTFEVIKNELVFNNGYELQVLGSIHDGDAESSLQLIWAGDIDGDGKLDLILNDLEHYNVAVNYKLYLSSKARFMVREVASFFSLGC